LWSLGHCRAQQTALSQSQRLLIVVVLANPVDVILFSLSPFHFAGWFIRAEPTVKEAAQNAARERSHPE
jgi:hypothetical protein